MKRTTGVLIATALTAFGAASFASTAALSEAFGPTKQAVALEDARLHADQLFEKIDIDRDGALSIDEYASQAVVVASLARFNGVIAIDGRETYNVELPEELNGRIGAVEQTAIDAVARNEFYKISGDDTILTKQEWMTAKMGEFAQVDFNDDGALKGSELEVFAMNIARYKITMS